MLKSNNNNHPSRMITPNSSYVSCRMTGLSLYVRYLMALLCFILASPVHTHARPLARAQRQTLTGELATGLTGTGMSFNPLYEGQSISDSYFGYQSEQRRTGQYDDYGPSILDGNNNNWSRHGIKGSYGTKIGGEYGYGSGGGLTVGSGYPAANWPSYGYASSHGKRYGNANGFSYGYGKSNGNDWGGWQGFGGGKNPAYGGPSTSQFGLKY